MTDAIVAQMKMNAGIIQGLTADVPDARIYEQPGPLVNHFAWQLGHLTNAHAAVAELLGQPGPIASKDFDAFKQGSTPEKNPIDRKSKEYFLSAYLSAQRHLTDVVGKLSHEELQEPNPIERIRGQVPTVLNLVMFVGAAHDAWHIGCLCDLRRAMGLPPIL